MTEWTRSADRVKAKGAPSRKGRPGCSAAFGLTAGILSCSRGQVEVLLTVTILAGSPVDPAQEVSVNQVAGVLAPVLRLPVRNMTTNADSDLGSPRASIRFDHATLRSEAAGTHTRYTIALTSRPDAAWYGAYAAACDQAGLLRTFPVDRGRAT